MKVQSDNGIAALAEGRAAEATSSHKGVSDAKQSASSGEIGSSSLELSSEVKQVERIADIARSESDFRIDVVEQARADLAAGTLNADPSELAALIARDLF